MAASHYQSTSDNEPENPCLLETEIFSQGLRKQILKKGHSWQTPFPGDEVEVHYSGRIEGGEYFDSSRDRGTPFKFKLGQCEVIKGWDEGVATMKKGERAIFTIPPELAYGEAGSPPLIPPNSTLIFNIEMLSWSTIRDIAGDGGIMKKITQEDEGWATPKDGDEVCVKYDVRHENGILISSTENGIKFHIGDGHFCPAISMAVKTMRKDEKAELSVKFSYGFQQSGTESVKIDGGIPTNSNLIIHLYLISWKSVIDVMGDKKVLKKIMKAGEGFDRPNEGSRVQVIYTVKDEDGTVFEMKGTQEEPFEYICFEEQINESLDRAIMTMRKGEQAQLTVYPELFDSHEVLGKSVLYEVELINFTKEKPFWKLDTQEKIEACEKKKLEGNSLFKAGKFLRASKKYEKAVKYIDFDHSFTGEEKSLARTLRLSCNLNNAACKLKLGEYSETSRLCSKVLELDPFSVKALYRRSQAYLRTSDLGKAEADIKRALAIDPNNRDLKFEYKELRMKQKEYARDEAEMFSTMFSRVLG